MSERCVVCGEEIPEGRQVCPVCATVAGTIRGVEEHDAIAMLKEQKEQIDKPKIGAWIRHGEPPQYVVECSRCGTKYFNHALQPFARYCSGCGSKMESWMVDDQTDERWNRGFQNADK